MALYSTRLAVQVKMMHLGEDGNLRGECCHVRIMTTRGRWQRNTKEAAKDELTFAASGFCSKGVYLSPNLVMPPIPLIFFWICGLP